jgi:predicted nucleic acid-binding protein
MAPSVFRKILLAFDGSESARTAFDRGLELVAHNSGDFAIVAVVRPSEFALDVEVSEILETVRGLCNTEPLTVETHERGIQVAQRYGFSIYDSMIVVSALLGGCKTLYAEDLQHGQVIDKQLTVINPFAKI